MNRYDVVIAGSGMGGLLCGDLLSREGYRVCILEKNKQIGGCLQIYARDRVIFDSGVHYIGGLAPGQNLYKIFRYLGLMDKLKLERMNPDAFDKIMIEGDDTVYPLAQGYENFIRQLLPHFPEEGEALHRYCERIRSICSKFPLYNLRSGDYAEKESELGADTSAFIDSLTANQKLRAVLAGNNFLYAGQADKTPLYVHALIQNHYIESAWKCTDGGHRIGQLMAANIRAAGGAVLTGREVCRFVEEAGKITRVETTGGASFYGDIFISNIHPEKTLDMTASQLIRPIFRKRISSLENSVSSFTLNIVLKEDCFPYEAANYYYHRPGYAWSAADYTTANWPLAFAVFLSPGRGNTKFAAGMSLLTYMRFDEVRAWAGTINTAAAPAGRGTAYEQFKEQKASALLDEAEKKFPGLRNCIHSYYTATPLSFRDYIGNADGSMYGIVKNYRDPHRTFIPPRTKVPNLYFTGQNLNLHGILGTALSGLATCMSILGNDSLLEKINHEEKK